MSPAATLPRADADLLSEMMAVAHAFGMAFAAEGRAHDDTESKLKYYELFDRCFRAVRISIALKLRLGQPLRDALAMPADPDRRERDDDRWADADRDRDTDREAASLPALIKSLGVIEREATELGARLPAPLRNGTLPTLRDILDRAKAPADAPPGRRASLAAGTSGVALKIRPSPPAPARGSTPAWTGIRSRPP